MPIQVIVSYLLIFSNNKLYNFIHKTNPSIYIIKNLITNNDTNLLAIDLP